MTPIERGDVVLVEFPFTMRRLGRLSNRDQESVDAGIQLALGGR